MKNGRVDGIAVALVDPLADFPNMLREVLAEANDGENSGLRGAHKPIGEFIENGEYNGKMQRKMSRGVNRDKSFVERVGEPGRIELVVGFGKGVFSDDVGGQGHPSTA